MDISETQERKQTMENHIAQAVQCFEDAAGVTVGNYVTVNHMDITDNSDYPRRRYIVTAKTEVAL